MRRYLLGRLLQTLVVVFLVTTASFVLVHLAPGDPFATDDPRVTEAMRERYRAALGDGNPAELWEARGESLWKEKRGPKGASLERCDLGLGPGVVKGAYAQLPNADRYGSGFNLSALGGATSLLLLALSTALGLLGSWLAVGRHLDAIQPS